METKIITNVKKMKADIKVKAEEQKELKNQRKTTKLVGDRKLEPWQATSKHQMNREDLRIMYAAYGLARGKSFNQIENHYPEDGHPLKSPFFQRRIDRILEKYKEKVEVETEI